MNLSTTPDKYVTSSGCRLSADLEILRHSAIFSGLNLDVVKLFAYLSNHRMLKPGDVLVEQGSKAEKAFLVISGSAVVTVEHRGRTVTLQRVEEGSFFGELALLAPFKWFFNVQALDDLEVLIIARTAFQKVIDKYPKYKDTLIERLVQMRIGRLANQTAAMLDQMLDEDTKAEIII